MAHTVVGLFETRETALAVVNDLRQAGLSDDQISILSSNRSSEAVPLNPATLERLERGEQVTEDTVKGALLGGAGGIVAGLAALAIPGLGPILVAGPLLTALGGAAVGAATGAAIGGLRENGIIGDEADIYAEAVRRGGTLVMAHVHGDNNTVAEIMDRHHPIDVDAASTTFRSEGFTKFDDTREHDGNARLPVVPVGTGTGRRVRVYDRT